MHATHLIDVRESLSFRRNEGALPELLQLHLDLEEVGFDVHLVLALGRLFAGHVHLEESLSVEPHFPTLSYNLILRGTCCGVLVAKPAS